MFGDYQNSWKVSDVNERSSQSQLKLKEITEKILKVEIFSNHFRHRDWPCLRPTWSFDSRQKYLQPLVGWRRECCSLPMHWKSKVEMQSNDEDSWEESRCCERWAFACSKAEINKNWRKLNFRIFFMNLLKFSVRVALTKFKPRPFKFLIFFLLFSFVASKTVRPDLALVKTFDGNPLPHIDLIVIKQLASGHALCQLKRKRLRGYCVNCIKAANSTNYKKVLEKIDTYCPCCKGGPWLCGKCFDSIHR